MQDFSTSRIGLKVHVDTKGIARVQGEMTAMYAAINAGSAIASAALTAVGAAFVAIGAGAFVALGATQNFQNEMTTLKALSGITTKEMYALAETVNSVATEFGVAGDEIAAGTVTLAKAGLTVDEINESIGAMTMLARANGVAFDQAAEITVFAVETFGKSFSESAEMMDAMQVAAQESILNIEDLQAAFAYAGSTASMTGISFEQLISLMAVLSNRAMVAGISSRSLNKMFIDMLQHTDALNQFMESMGMTFNIIRDGKLDIDALIAAFSDQQMSLEILQGANDIFTVRALRAFGLLIGASDDYATMLDKVNTSSGALTRVAGTMMESWSVQFGKMKQEFLAMLRTEEIMIVLTQMVSKLTEMMAALKPQVIAMVVAGLVRFTEVISGEKFKSAILTIITAVQLLFNSLVGVFNVMTAHGGALIYLAGAWLIGAKAIAPLVMALWSMQTAAVGTAVGFDILGASLTRGVMGLVLISQGAGLAVDALGGLMMAMALYTSITWGYTAAQAALNSQFLATVAVSSGLAATTFSKYAAPRGASVVGGWGAMNSGTQAATVTPEMAGKKGSHAGWKVGTPLTAAAAAKAGPTSTKQLGGLLWAGSKLMKTPYLGAGLRAAGGIGSKLLGPWGIAASIALPLLASAVMDTGGFYNQNRSIFDTGGVAPRHQLAWLEPGEQVISKTQGMAGMGGAGVNVYVGDVYTQDGTDFAEKVAEALPRALRRTSYGGGF